MLRKFPNQFSSMLAVITFIFFVAVDPAISHTSVVVVPLGDSPVEGLANIVTVAKENGDFEDPASAVASISDATEDNPYMVYVAPGTYILESRIELSPYVHLIGSGKHLTILDGSFGEANGGAGAAVISIVDPEVFVRHTSIQGMRIINRGNGSGGVVVGVYCDECNSKIKDVDVDVFGGTTNLGIDVSGPGGVHLEGSSVEALGGAISIAIQIFSTNSSLHDVVAIAEDATSTNVGIQVSQGSIDTHKVSANATGGSYGYGIRLIGLGSDLDDVDVNGSGSDEGYGIHILDIGSFFTSTVRNSKMQGSDDGFNNTTRVTTNISHSVVQDGVGGAGAKTCVAVSNGAGSALSTSCL